MASLRFMNLSISEKKFNCTVSNKKNKGTVCATHAQCNYVIVIGPFHNDFS